MSAGTLDSQPLPGWIVEKLEHPPLAGTGVNLWHYACACALLPWRSRPEILRILTEAARRCTRLVTPDELQRSVNRAKNDWLPGGGGTPRIKAGLRYMRASESPAPAAKPRDAGRRPRADFGHIAEVASSGLGLADLWEASPVRVDGGFTGLEVIDALFPGDPFLCCAKETPADALTLPRRDWTGMEGWPGDFAFLVPSPMRGVTGKRQDGKSSPRCLDNTGERRWLVVEFDFVRAKEGQPSTPGDALLQRLEEESPPRRAPDLCASLLLHLVEAGAPLALAVHSGGKSLHGWFPVSGMPAEALEDFFRQCRRLGADGATWTRCQLVRLPEGRRPDGRRQPVYYFNPAICAAAARA